MLRLYITMRKHSAFQTCRRCLVCLYVILSLSDVKSWINAAVDRKGLASMWYGFLRQECRERREAGIYLTFVLALNPGIRKTHARIPHFT